MIQNTRGDLSELTAIELSRFPIALNKSSFRRDEFIDQLSNQQMV